jgi:hypothetical protein
MILEQPGRQTEISTGLKLDMREPGRRGIDPEHLVDLGENRIDVRLDRQHRTVHR